jgi:hypothetical protein
MPTAATSGISVAINLLKLRVMLISERDVRPQCITSSEDKPAAKAAVTPKS